MLELKTNLRQTIEPLVYLALKEPLNRFAEQHWREADRNNLTTITFRRKLAALAAEYYTERKGNARWRGIVDQDSSKQIVIELARIRTRYSAHTRTSGIHAEDITKLANTNTMPRRRISKSWNHSQTDTTKPKQTLQD